MKRELFASKDKNVKTERALMKKKDELILKNKDINELKISHMQEFRALKSQFLFMLSLMLALIAILGFKHLEII